MTRLAISALVAVAVLAGACLQPGASSSAPRARGRLTGGALSTSTQTVSGTGTEGTRSDGVAASGSDAPGADPAGGVADPAASSAPDAPDPALTPLSDSEAIGFLQSSCGGCHDAQQGAVAAFWALHPGELRKTWLGADEMAPNVYYALLVKAKGLASGMPAPMPPGPLDAATTTTLRRLVRWFETELPAVTGVARAKFQGATNDPAETGIVLDFRCEEPLSNRELLTRFTGDFFDRPPSEAELTGIFAGALDQPSTATRRRQLAERLFTDADWRRGFETISLRKFADKLGGAADIGPTAGISREQADDLRQELYQLLLADYATRAYADILLGDKVMVSASTARLYPGCAAPAAGIWQACRMAAPRGSYFTSLSFLLSRPTSFLLDNNNYGRAKLMHFLISGDVFKSAFTGDRGNTAVRPLPSCLSTQDRRGIYNSDRTVLAPYGTAAVPAEGNLCQSCHIARHLAAGSLLFRPFAPSGLVYERETPLAFDPQIEDATTELRVVRKAGGGEERVSVTWLRNLLADVGERACAVPPGGETAVPVASVAELARLLIGDGRVLATGLARHLPRALSNKPNTTEELIGGVMAAYAASGGRLAEVFKAYATSETFGCRAKP